MKCILKSIDEVCGSERFKAWVEGLSGSEDFKAWRVLTVFPWDTVRFLAQGQKISRELPGVGIEVLDAERFYAEQGDDKHGACIFLVSYRRRAFYACFAGGYADSNPPPEIDRNPITMAQHYHLTNVALATMCAMAGLPPL